MKMTVTRIRRVRVSLDPHERPEFPMQAGGTFVTAAAAMDVTEDDQGLQIRGITVFGYPHGREGGGDIWMEIDPNNAPFSLHPVLQNMLAAR